MTGRNPACRRARQCRASTNNIGALRLDYFADFVFQDVFDYVPAVFFAACERLTELEGLLHGDFTGQRRLIGIDDGLDNYWAAVTHRFAKNGASIFRIFDGEADGAATFRYTSKIDGLQVHAKFRIPLHHNLFPLD